MIELFRFPDIPLNSYLASVDSIQQIVTICIRMQFDITSGSLGHVAELGPHESWFGSEQVQVSVSQIQ